MKKTVLLAATGLMWTMAFVPANAVTFQEYAKWDDKKKSQFGGWLLAKMEQQALKKGDKAFAECIDKKFVVGSNEMTDFIAALEANAEMGTVKFSAEKVGATNVYSACKSAPDFATR